MSDRASCDTIGTLIKLCEQIFRGEEITTRLIRDKYKVSPATAKRYMILLETYLPVEALFEEVGNGGCYQPRKTLRLMQSALRGLVAVSGSTSSRAAPRAMPPH